MPKRSAARASADRCIGLPTHTSNHPPILVYYSQRSFLHKPYHISPKYRSDRLRTFTLTCLSEASSLQGIFLARPLTPEGRGYLAPGHTPARLDAVRLFINCTGAHFRLSIVCLPSVLSPFRPPSLLGSRPFGFLSAREARLNIDTNTEREVNASRGGAFRAAASFLCLFRWEAIGCFWLFESLV